MAAAVAGLTNFVSLSVKHVALNPVITASILWILTKGPPRAREQLFSRFSSLRDPNRLAKIIKALKWLLALGVTGTVNKQFNKLALNSWRFNDEKSRWNWSQEIVVVTGGCSGIGEMVVRKLVDRGVTVAVLDIQQLPASLQGFPQVKFFACDITDPATVYDTAKRIKTTLGSPTVLVNNAGIARAHTILNTSDEDLRKIFDVNLLSNFTTVKAFLPDMIKANKGHIVTVASTASYIAVAGMVDYTSTKAGVLAFHEGLKQELQVKYKAPNVLLTSIHPNWVRTPLIEPFAEEIERFGSKVIEPREVADAIVQGILSCAGNQVFLPSTASRVSMLRSLPNWLQENFRQGISSSVVKSAQ